MKTFEGIFPALCTPYDRSGHISRTVLKELVEFHLSIGVSGLWLGGGSAEYQTMSEEERRIVVETVVGHVAGRATIMAHVGAKNDDGVVLRLAKHAKETGADAVAAIPPCPEDDNVEPIIAYYWRLAEVCPLPIFVYNHPASTGVHVRRELMEKLLTIPTVTGIKFSETDLVEMRKLVTLDSGRLSVLFGIDPMMLAGLMMGACGGVGLTYNYFPGAFLRIWDAFRRNDLRSAVGLQHRLSDIIADLYRIAPNVVVMKYIVELLGFQCGPPRPPYQPLEPCQKASIHRIFEANRDLFG